MVAWIELFKNKSLLEKCGKDAANTAEFAKALSKETKEKVTVDALFNAHKRHKTSLRLKKSLTDYIQPTVKEEKPKLIKPEDVTHILSHEQKKAIKKAKKFIVTSAMNNAHIDENLWASIQTYAKYNDAEIVVIPVRYRNPTSPQESNQLFKLEKSVYQAWWPEALQKYTTDELLRIHEHLWIMGHIRVQATASHPLKGMSDLSSGASAVFGHANVAMETVATPQNKLPKVMYTTGSVTVPQYSASRAGQRGERHHKMGAVVIELDGPRFHIRNVESRNADGGFYDLDKYYSPEGVRTGNEILALVTGDEHAMFADPQCKQATYLASDSIVNVLRPKRLVRHDVFDGYSINHHERKDPLVQYSKHQQSHHLVKAELELTLKHIEETTPSWATNDIVPSNHNGFLFRWMKDVHALKDEPWNAEIWLELWLEVIKSTGWAPNGVTHVDPFEEWCKARTTVPLNFIKLDSNEMILDIAIDLHGDYGINGSRGSIGQFAKIGVRTVTGHGHSPGICHDASRVGTSSYLKLPYTHGPSSWAHCHGAIHDDGAIQLIFVVDGRWHS